MTREERERLAQACDRASFRTQVAAGLSRKAGDAETAAHGADQSDALRAAAAELRRNPLDELLAWVNGHIDTCARVGSGDVFGLRVVRTQIERLGGRDPRREDGK